MTKITLTKLQSDDPRIDGCFALSNIGHACDVGDHHEFILPDGFAVDGFKVVWVDYSAHADLKTINDAPCLVTHMGDKIFLRSA